MEENKMKNRKIMLAVIALVIVTAIVAVVHLGSVPQVPENEILVQQGTEEKYVSVREEAMVAVTGTLVNGKGDQIPVDAMGLSLADVIELSGIDDYDVVTVTARDEYRVEVTAEEIHTENKVYLTVDTDGTFRLVVFGDSNSKRNVSDVIKLTIQ